MPALADGRLIPLRADVDGVAAYVRRSGTRMALVVANLTSEPVSKVALFSERGALPTGNWRLQSLLDSTRSAPLHVNDDGRLDGYRGLGSIAALEGRVFELRR